MKRKKRRKDQLGQPVPLPAEATPPMPSPQAPSPEIFSSELSIIDLSLISKPSEMPKGLNRNDMIVIVTGDPKRTANLQRLIWSLTGMLVVGLGSISVIAIFALHYRVAGEVGAATAAIAGIMSVIAKIRLRNKRDSL